MIIWVVTPCCSVDRYQRFGENCCFHLQREDGCRSEVHLRSEDGCSEFLRNVGTYPPYYMDSHPRRDRNLHDDRRETALRKAAVRLGEG
jgi:hypothetical protein